MPYYVIERQFAEELNATAEAAAEVKLVNDLEGVRWLYSFLSLDRRKTYCVYEAPDPEAIRRAADRAGLPADVIIEIAGKLEPDASLVPA